MTGSDRESWEPVVAEMIKGARKRSEAINLTRFLAGMLEKDVLPESGRKYLADRLRIIAEGRDPFPRKPTKKPRNKLAVLIAVAREAQKHEKQDSDVDMAEVYETVSKRLGTKPTGGRRVTRGAVKKYASIARGWVRDTLERNVTAGTERRSVIAGIGHLYGLSPQSVERYLL